MPTANICMKSIELCIFSQLNTQVTVNFHVQVNATIWHSKFEVHQVMTEQLFNALKAIETLASGMIKVYGMKLGPYHSSGPDLGHRAVHKPSLYSQLRLLTYYSLNCKTTVFKF